MTKDLLISDFSDERFQAAFRLYFDELGLQVKDWDRLWLEMNADNRAVNHAFVRLDETGSVIGFIQFCELTMKSWFFEEKLGFIREFWVRSSVRGQGHGSALLSLTEYYFKQQGISKCILTTDTAPHFYKKHGYVSAPSVQARNRDEVFIKKL